MEKLNGNPTKLIIHKNIYNKTNHFQGACKSSGTTFFDNKWWLQQKIDSPGMIDLGCVKYKRCNVS